MEIQKLANLFLLHQNRIFAAKRKFLGFFSTSKEIMDDLPKRKGCNEPRPRLHADAPEFNPNQPAWAPRAADKVFWW